MREEIQALLKSREYDFLRTNQNLGNHICLLTLGGSKAYGTNIEGSDTDIRGVSLRTKEDILLGRDFGTITDSKTDTVVYSFDKTIELLANANPNTLELFGMPREYYFVLTEPGKLLLDNIDLFLSQRCAKSFCGYANSQLYRLKQKSTYKMDKIEYHGHIQSVLNQMELEFREKYQTDLQIQMDKDGELSLCGTFNHLSMNQMHEVLNTLNNTYRDYQKRSERNEKAESHNKINKHAMHLIRLYAMGIDLLNEGKIITKRDKDHELLMYIRNKMYLDENGSPTKEFFDLVTYYETQFKQALKTTDLPKEPNQKEIDELKMAVNQSIVQQNSVNYERNNFDMER